MLKRTHTCGVLRKSEVGKEAILTGWVASRRDHGGLVFIDLRDRYGLTQVVFNPALGKELHEKAGELRAEFVVAVRGEVRERPPGTVNPRLPTGEIELYARELDILNRSEMLPFEVEEGANVSLEHRLRYRYLDLRRPTMQHHLIFRHRLCQLIRQYLDSQGFVEVETPFLTKSTPEGARDYLVPSRMSPGAFYALPQSPQLFKQILMVAGLDRYFQIVRCFRDEDLRATRQPEFTQLDMEMSFVEEEDVMSIIEGFMVEVFEKLLGKKVSTPFPRLPYSRSMELYGSDAPDMRFGMTIKEITDLAKGSEFRIFKETVERGGLVRGLNAQGCGTFSRKEIEELTGFVGQHGAKGLAWFKVEGGSTAGDSGLASPITKFFPQGLQVQIRERMEARPGDLLLFVADREKIVSQSLSQLRLNLAKRLNLIKGEEYCFTWITDFPLLEFDETLGRYISIHHPFTSPKLEDLPHLEERPREVRARAYDIVLNGVELGGGSIRIHDQELQQKIFRLLGMDDETARKRFGFLLEAFKYGAPPHGGIALGLDRLAAMLLGLEDIREVIAFPKTQKASCLMTDAPSEVDAQQLKELGIKLL